MRQILWERGGLYKDGMNAARCQEVLACSGGWRAQKVLACSLTWHDMEERVEGKWERVKAVLPLARVRRFTRKTRDYKRAYMAWLMSTDEEKKSWRGYNTIEKHVKGAKGSHRSALDLDYATCIEINYESD